MAFVRQYTSAAIGLEIDGEFVGFVAAMSGGEPYATVVDEPVGGDSIVHKHIGEVHYEPIVIEAGLDLDSVLFTWIGEALAGSSKPRNGRVRFFDHALKERDALEFTEATLTSVTLPALDAASRSSARLTVTLTPNKTRHSKASGKVPALGRQSVGKTLTSNFVVDIDGLHSASGFVHSVDPITITCVPAVDVGAITMTVAAAHADDFRKWFDGFVLGPNPGADERDGTIELRDQSMKNPLLTIELGHLGIVRVSQANEAGSSETAINRIGLEMYCEMVRLTVGQPKEVTHKTGSTGGGTGKNIDDIATRLVSSATEVGPGRVGAMWAEGTASLDELSAVAALDGQDWDVVTLDEDHTLLSTLRDAGVVADGTGSVVLERDPEIEQIISDAADVYRKVLGTVEERMAQTASEVVGNLK